MNQSPHLSHHAYRTIDYASSVLGEMRKSPQIMFPELCWPRGTYVATQNPSYQTTAVIDMRNPTPEQLYDRGNGIGR